MGQRAKFDFQNSNRRPWPASAIAGRSGLLISIVKEQADFLVELMLVYMVSLIKRKKWASVCATCASRRGADWPQANVSFSPTHHALHHETYRGNYSLYLNVWDRLMGTNRPEYAERFQRAAGGDAD